MSNTTPKISIGLAVYNGEKYLAAAIECFLAQTHSDFELILSDNYSTDRTEAICREYAARDSRIRYHRHLQNIGANANFNHAFSLARGEYFKWAAHDDLCAPTFLERCCEVLDNDPSVVWCHTAHAKIGSDGRTIQQPPDHSKAGRGEDCQSASDHLRFRDVILQSSYWGIRLSGLIRTEVLRETELMRMYYGCDKLLCAEVVLTGCYHQVPETLFFQRVHEDCSSLLETAEQQQEFACPGNRVRLPRLRILRDYFGVIWSARIGLGQRFCCLLWIACYVCQFRKWPRVVRKLWLGRGVGAGEKDLLDELKAGRSQTASGESPESRHSERPQQVVSAKHSLTD